MLNDWLNNEVTNISNKLEKINKEYFFKEKTIGFAGKECVYRIIQELRSALFPGVYEKYPIDQTRANILIGNNIRAAAILLFDLIEKSLMINCKKKEKDHLNCNECKIKANDITINFISKLPMIREYLNKDIVAAYNGDPAAVNTEEILLSYPAIEVLSIYRIAHELYKMAVPLIPRIMAEYAHQLTGIDIHPGATIGEYFFIDHGTGVVIGETCIIGNNVKLYQGVTLGAKSFPLDELGNPIKNIKRHPNIEDNVVVYAGATILGGDTTIGRNSVIGGNVWLTHSVPPYSNVYNAQPSPIIKSNNCD